MITVQTNRRANMPRVLVTDQYLYDIASAIRGKLDVETEYLPSEMAAAIESISGISQDDNGKVVQNGALVGQTQRTITDNGTYDTTTNNEVVVSVSGGSYATLVSKTITENGTYDPADDEADGYSEVVVNVPQGSGNIPEIEPHVFDLHSGYVGSGEFYYEAPSSTYCDVYQVEQNTMYFILLDDIVGNRFRGMLSDSDTSTATSNIRGTSAWSDMSNPNAYEIRLFNSGTNSYLTVGKDNANTSGIKTHLFKLDDLIDYLLN